MIAQLVRQYIAGPIATIYRRVAGGLEPVAVAGAILAGVTIFRDALSGGADLETALTATIIAIGTRVVRQNVWPDAAIHDGAPEEPLGEPITGLDGQ